jgi:Family of unknown function (DUF6599)
MRRLILVSVTLLFAVALPACAQKILPASVAGWAQPTGATLAAFTSAPPAILAEYGSESTEVAVYGDPSSRNFQVMLHEMKDASGAYGLYSYLRAPDMRPANFTDHSSMTADRALVLAGNLVLDVQGRDLAGSSAQLKALVATVSPQAQDSSLPNLPFYLPEERRVDVSDRYILGPETLDQLFPGGIGNSVGFQRSAEAELAHYRLGEHDATLLIVGFPTDQLAALQLAELQKNLNVNGPKQSSAPLFANRSARLLAIVAGATSQAEANTLLDQIQVETERSWNEPVPKNEPRIELMIEGSIVGAMTICMFALVAGVSFGGLRLIVKRVAPGKVFDRSSQLQVLQLGLGSKPINSDDFYGYTRSTGPAPNVDKDLPDRVALRIFR